jgi:glutathione S-transferase
MLLDETGFRPQTKSCDPRIDRARSQMHGALAEIDRLAQIRAGEWMVAGRMTQADITLACVFSFLCDALQLGQPWVPYPGLTALGARCEGIPAFGELRAKFTPSESALPQAHDHAAR